MKGEGAGSGERVVNGAMRVVKYLGEVGEAGADEIGYHCEIDRAQFKRIKQLLGLKRRWTVEADRTKPLYSLADGSMWQAVFGERSATRE